MADIPLHKLEADAVRITGYANGYKNCSVKRQSITKVEDFFKKNCMLTCRLAQMLDGLENKAPDIPFVFSILLNSISLLIQ